MTPRGETFRHVLAVKGRQGVTMTVAIVTHRGRVWISLDQTFSSEAILRPEQVDSLIGVLGQAVREARRCRQSDTA